MTEEKSDVDEVVKLSGQELVDYLSNLKTKASSLKIDKALEDIKKKLRAAAVDDKNMIELNVSGHRLLAKLDDKELSLTIERLKPLTVIISSAKSCLCEDQYDICYHSPHILWIISFP